MRVTQYLLALSLAIELGSFASLLLDASAAHRILIYCVFHAMACLLATRVLFDQLLPSLRKRGYYARMFLFAIALFIPLIGIAGLWLLSWVMTLPEKEVVDLGWANTEISDLPSRPFRVSAQPIYLAVGLIGVLRHANDPDLRQRAVMATRQMNDQHAIPILNVALKDPVDDVRLLAYAILDNKERKIFARIKEGNQRLTQATSDERRVTVHRALGRDYWELAYLGLAQGEVLIQVLKAAHEHMNAVLAIQPDDPGAYQMLGRIYLKQGDPHRAHAAFVKATELGLGERSIIPYLAEVAFELRAFEQVREHMQSLGDFARRRVPMAWVAQYWLDNPALTEEAG